MVNVKITNSDNGYILAVCDSELVGECISEGEKQLDLASDFYNGEEKSEEEISDLMRNAYIVNVVGEKSCDLAIKEGIVNKEDIKKVKSVPHAQIVLME